MGRFLAGLAILALAFYIGVYGTGDSRHGLLAVIIALVFMPPAFDPAFIIKEWLAEKTGTLPPKCFGEYPFNAGLCAERGCPYCPAGQECLALTRYRYRKD